MAAVLDVVNPLVTLLSQAPDPTGLAEAASACVARDDADALLAVLESCVTDGRLAGPVLRHAGVMDGRGALSPDAAVRVGQALVLLEAREHVWSPGWELLVTVPEFLRDAYTELVDEGRPGAGRVRETGQALFEVASSASSQLIVASPYLQAGFVEGLVPAMNQVLAAGGEVLVLTRALSMNARTQSSANVEAVELLRASAEAAVPRGGRLTVRSWEGRELGLHFKVVVADTTWAYLGSANLTTLGAAAHAEAGALLRGPSVAILESWLKMVAEVLRERHPR